MQKIRIDLAQIPQFFKGLEEVCNLFCQNQLNIDRAFNVIQEEWRDKNAKVTGEQLAETARDIAKVYLSIGEAIDYIVEVCNNRAEYADFGRIAPPRINQFTTSLMEITNMDDSVIITDPDALEEFKKELDKYSQSIVDNVDYLRNLYTKIGNSWDDVQYENFGDALSTFTSRMQTQIDVLDKISAFLKAKIDILRRKNI